jgi:hypothetical protein
LFDHGKGEIKSRIKIKIRSGHRPSPAGRGRIVVSQRVGRGAATAAKEALRVFFRFDSV